MQRPAVEGVEIGERHLQPVEPRVAALHLVVVARGPRGRSEAGAGAPVVRAHAGIAVRIGTLLRILDDVGNVDRAEARRGALGLHAGHAIGAVGEAGEGAVLRLVVEIAVRRERVPRQRVPGRAQHRERERAGDSARGAHPPVARGLELRVLDAGVNHGSTPSKSCGIWRKSLSLTQRWLSRRTSCRPRRRRSAFDARVFDVRLVHAGVARVGQQRIGGGRELGGVVVEFLRADVVGVDAFEREAQTLVRRGTPARDGAHRLALGALGLVAFLDAVVARPQLEREPAAGERVGDAEGHHRRLRPMSPGPRAASSCADAGAIDPFRAS